MKTTLSCLVIIAATGVCSYAFSQVCMIPKPEYRLPEPIPGRYQISGEYICDTITGRVVKITEWMEKQ